MKKVIIFLSFLLVLINFCIVDATEVKRVNIAFEQTINGYINAETHDLVLKLKEEADKVIFNHSLNPDTLNKFVDTCFCDIKYEKTFKEDIENYLISSKNVQDFIVDASYEIDEHIKKIYSDILERTINDGTISVKIKYKYNSKIILEKNLPSADDMIFDIYKDLVVKGHTKEYNSTILEMYKTYRNKYPKSTITIEAFTVVTVSLLSGGAGTTLGLIAINLENNNFREKEALKSTLKESILCRQDEFHDAIEKTSKMLTKAMVERLKEILKTAKLNQSINIKKL